MTRIHLRTLAATCCAVLLLHTPAAAQTLPSEWATRDIGAVTMSGQASGTTVSFMLEGEGADIWGTADAFRFVYKPLTGDGSIVTRVSNIEHVDVWTKAGVMMRDSLDAAARHASLFVSPGKGVAFQRRTALGGTTTHTGVTGAAPHFVRVTRSGSTFTAAKSVDGMTWTTVGTQTIAMPATIYVGMALTSHEPGVLATASFEATDVKSVSIAELPVPAPLTSVRVLHWNVHHGGVGTDGKRDYDRLVKWIAEFDADILSLNEVDSQAQVDAIVSRLTTKTATTWKTAFSGRGNLLLTRLPLDATSNCTYNASYPRVAAHLSVNVNGRPLNVWSAHLAVDSGSTRVMEVKNLQACAGAWEEARVVAGDYNMQSSSTEYKTMAATYVDAWLAAKALGTTTNYAGNCDGCTRNTRIDYVFASKGASFLTVKSAEVFDTRDASGVMPSDHKPMLVVYDVK